MSYYLSRVVALDFDIAVSRIKDALAKEGFGVLTDIDVQATLKEKTGAALEKYRILGACNPGIAHRALQVENKLGVLLPCNVIVREAALGRVEVAAIDPVASMERTENAQLVPLAADVRDRLQRAVDAV